MKNLINKFSLKKLEIQINASLIKSSTDIHNLAKKLYKEDLEVYESMFLVCLNRQYLPTAFVKLSQGGISETTFDVVIMTKYAIDTLSSAVILIHNHPSGNLKPSQSDFNMTKKAKEALNLFNIQILDHLIISTEGYYSLADNGDF